MSANIAAVLETPGNRRVVLESVQVEGSLAGLYAEVSMTQVYRNLEQDNIEAVYTFPLPLDAVLMELTLRLNGETLSGVVQPRAEAEERYEEAIGEGDSAVLLSQVEPGLYTVNVGNLLAGERAEIHIRYAQLHHWQGDRLRFHLPTTIAPRYGDPAAAGLAPHETPEYSWNAGRDFSLELALEGPLAHAGFDSPSHAVTVESAGERRIIRPRGDGSPMDRDFVLVFREPLGATWPALRGPDESGQVMLASFHPSLDPEEGNIPPRCIKLVVDCSGSMNGDSIAQARQALRDILALLKPADSFNIICFGFEARAMSPQAVAATPDALIRARRYVEGIAADMGGTEMGGALQLAYKTANPFEMPEDTLLITDGEVWRDGSIMEEAEASGHRVFTVGVGSAVSEAFVRDIAARTGGACELVSPRENMAERIVAHFRRIHQPRAARLSLEWPGQVVRRAPKVLPLVYLGDTLHVFGWSTEPLSGPVTLRMELDDGRVITDQVSLPAVAGQGEDRTELARMGAQARLSGLDTSTARDLAVQYQLVTEQTSCVLVKQRAEDEKAHDIPALRKVSQTLAAGWGGAGSVNLDGVMMMDEVGEVGGIEMDYLERPAFTRGGIKLNASVDIDSPGIKFSRVRSLDDSLEPNMDGAISELSLEDLLDPIDVLVEGLNARYPEAQAGRLDGLVLNDLYAMGLEAEVVLELDKYGGANDLDETEVVKCFFKALAESEAGKRFTRHVQRLIRQFAKGTEVDEAMREIAAGCLPVEIRE